MVMVVLMWMTMMISMTKTWTPIGYLVGKNFTDDKNLLSGDEHLFIYLHDGNCTSTNLIAKEIPCI